jgi:hypothetical protein
LPGKYGQLSAQPIVTITSARPPAGEVDAELAHDVDDLRVHAATGVGDAVRRAGGVPARGGALEQRLADLGAAGVVQADEQDLAHAAIT